MYGDRIEIHSNIALRIKYKITHIHKRHEKSQLKRWLCDSCNDLILRSLSFSLEGDSLLLETEWWIHHFVLEGISLVQESCTLSLSHTHMYIMYI